MSFYSDGQSQHSSVPPSAQPYQSLFGGYSQETQDLDAYSRLEQDESDFGVTAKGGPPVEYEDSGDDLSYIQTSDREPFRSPEKTGSVAPSSFPPPTLKSWESPESSASPSPHRPNKFHGPAHLWLDLTRDDRDIAESLDEIGARDLAAHLYNAHILQSRGAVNRGNENTDQLGDGDPQNGDLVNYELLDILGEWTAWPMSSDEVPRADERLRRLEDDKWTFRMRPDSRPSAELEESIMALLMKTAKERFQSREWASSTFSDRKCGILSDKGGAKPNTEGDMDVDQPSADETTAWESEQEALQRPLRPVVQIDDDVSRRKLRPLARNVITQFDQLLMGLHRFHGASRSDRSSRSRSRDRKRGRSSSLASNASCAYNGNTQTEDVSDTDNARPRTSSTGKKAARKTQFRSFSRGRKRTRRESQSSPRKNDSANTSRTRARSASTNGDGESGLTDWKDVVGVASMVGVPPAVLQRATQRFSALVGEDMEFPTIPEDHGPQFMESVLEWTYTQNKLAALARPEVLPSRDDSVKKERKLVCPFKRCSRHTNGFSRPWNLNQHLKTMHPGYKSKDSKTESRSRVQSGHDTDRSRAVHESADEGLPPTDHSVKKDQKLFCPFKGCNRHKKKGFSRQWNLNQHLKTMHPSYKPTESKSRSRSRVKSGYDSDRSE
ncbi:uncharacterized protein BDV17DRAFT_52510 [Aspergillus undulatus]|uniref:uncharacterized protein n=1 Tax=Aspergillus undulatus TaxID=1810928 RepID=UPI003CCD61A9